MPLLHASSVNKQEPTSASYKVAWCLTSVNIFCWLTAHKTPCVDLNGQSGFETCGFLYQLSNDVGKSSWKKEVMFFKGILSFFKFQVYVVPPAEMLFLPSRVEAAIGHNLSLPVQVMGYTDESKKHLLAFPDCHSLKVEITTSDVSIFNVTVESNKGRYCATSSHTTPTVFLSKLTAGEPTSWKIENWFFQLMMGEQCFLYFTV